MRLQETRTAQVDRNGRFELKLDKAFPYQEVFLRIGKKFMSSLIVNCDLKIHVDVKKFKKGNIESGGAGVAYSGSDAEMTKYVNKFRRMTQKKMMPLMMRQSQGTSDRNIGLEAMLKTVNEVREETKRIKEDCVKKFPSAHDWIIEEALLSDFYDTYLRCCLNTQSPIDPAMMEQCLSHEPRVMSASSSSYYHHLNFVLSAWNKDELWTEVLRREITDPSEQEGLQKFLTASENARAKKPHNKEVL